MSSPLAIHEFPRLRFVYLCRRGLTWRGHSVADWKWINGVVTLDTDLPPHLYAEMRRNAQLSHQQADGIVGRDLRPISFCRTERRSVVGDRCPTFVSSSSGTCVPRVATTIEPDMNRKMKRNRERWRGRNDEADTAKCWLARRPWWNASSSAAMLNDSGGAARRQRRGERHVRELDRTRERPFNSGWGGGVSSRRSLVPRYLNPNGQRATRSDLLLASYFCAMLQFRCASLEMPTSGGFTHTPTLEKIARVGRLKQTLNSRAALKFSNASPGSGSPAPHLKYVRTWEQVVGEVMGGILWL